MSACNTSKSSQSQGNLRAVYKLHINITTLRPMSRPKCRHECRPRLCPSLCPTRCPSVRFRLCPTMHPRLRPKIRFSLRFCDSPSRLNWGGLLHIQIEQIGVATLGRPYFSNIYSLPTQRARQRDGGARDEATRGFLFTRNVRERAAMSPSLMKQR